MENSNGRARTKVLFLASTLPTGGAEKIFVAVAEGLKKDGFQVQMVTLKKAGELEEAVKRAGVPVEEGVMEEKASLTGFLRLFSIIRKANPAVLYMLDHRNTVVAGTIASLISGVRARVVAVHSTRLWGGKKSLPFPIPLLVPFIERIVAVSDSHREYLSGEEGIPAKRISVIRNGIDLSLFEGENGRDSLRGELGVPEDVPVIGCVAGLRPEKGHLVLLSAAKELLSTFGDCFFLLVGDGKMRDELQAEASRIGIQSRVIFAGRRSDVPELLRLMDIFVLPSLPVVETAPLSVMEAMACGKAVVATDVGSLREVVDDGVTGLIVPPGDSQSLARAIMMLLDDPGRMRLMGKMGREKALREFDVNTVVRETENLIESIVSE